MAAESAIVRSEASSKQLKGEIGLESILPLPGQRVLYWGSGSPPAWRVLIALTEKNLKFRSVCLSFSSGILKSEALLKLNPRGMVPIFVEPDGLCLYESLAILEYLDRAYPKPALFPSDPAIYGLAQMKMHEANNLSVVSGELIYYLRRNRSDQRNSAFLRGRYDALHKELHLWETHLQGKTYLAGESFTMADISFFPNLAYNVRCGLALNRLYPNLYTYYNKVCRRPTVQFTWPPHWKESKGVPYLSFNMDGEDGNDDDEQPGDDYQEEAGSHTKIPEGATAQGGIKQHGGETTTCLQ